MPPRLDYVELPAARLDDAVRFYEAAFGWTLQRFGPSYAATTTGDTDIGLQGPTDPPAAAADVHDNVADSAQEAGNSAGTSTVLSIKVPLPIIQVDDVDETEAAVTAAGGEITRPVFAFPGGRRFHFRDPSGNELAAWQRAAPPQQQ